MNWSGPALPCPALWPKVSGAAEGSTPALPLAKPGDTYAPSSLAGEFSNDLMQQRLGQRQRSAPESVAGHGSRPSSFTSRELRREAERNARKAAKQAKPSKRGGF